MSAPEFREWQAIYESLESHEDYDAIREMAWRGMLAEVDRAERQAGDIEDAGRQIGDGIAWAAFWLAAGAVLVASIFKGYMP